MKRRSSTLFVFLCIITTQHITSHHLPTNIQSAQVRLQDPKRVILVLAHELLIKSNKPKPKPITTSTTTLITTSRTSQHSSSNQLFRRQNKMLAQEPKQLMVGFKAVLNGCDDTPFANDQEKRACENVLTKLTSEELEGAACASYAYWWMTKYDHGMSDEYMQRAQHAMALRECRRHYIGEGKKCNKTLAAIKEALQYRLEYDMESIRSCIAPFEDFPFASTKTNLKHEKDGSFITMEELKDMILDELTNKQEMVVRGHSKEHSAILYKHTRTARTEETNPQAYLYANIYIAERGLAVNEFLSLGKQEKLLVIFNFRQYNSANSPPHHLHDIMTKMMSRTYPERLAKLILMEPSLWLRVGYKLVYPFLARDTRDKIAFLPNVQSEQRKRAVFGHLVDPEQATQHLLHDGKLTSPLDAKHFVMNVPFHQLYDDVPLVQ